MKKALAGLIQPAYIPASHDAGAAEKRDGGKGTAEVSKTRRSNVGRCENKGLTDRFGSSR
ncbi:hypothetical protein Sp245p_27970 (plasmid) [Azospirillum baldaniorum]|uniref:Uncharacterized protein n=1 Tax=Azospirillum baldaniorum TaxID=1064539 RepID=A0A9P1NQC4_9PROT|nr:hypothetical protein Sp245p_27970 [Azospirillum baldaniorum]CCD01773.1 protein of unknown function [Azospirillum baldaniorum]